MTSVPRQMSSLERSDVLGTRMRAIPAKWITRRHDPGSERHADSRDQTSPVASVLCHPVGRVKKNRLTTRRSRVTATVFFEKLQGPDHPRHVPFDWFVTTNPRLVPIDWFVTINRRLDPIDWFVTTNRRLVQIDWFVTTDRRLAPITCIRSKTKGFPRRTPVYDFPLFFRFLRFSPVRFNDELSAGFFEKFLISKSFLLHPLVFYISGRNR